MLTCDDLPASAAAVADREVIGVGGALRHATVPAGDSGATPRPGTRPSPRSAPMAARSQSNGKNP